MLNKLLTFVILSLSPGLALSTDNLFSQVSLIEFENGFKAVLAPSQESRLVGVEFEVDVGWDAETRDNWGVSHLLEHSVFRDVKLNDDLTYLQLIEENGGSANGFTQARKTIYKAEIGRKKSGWLVDQFYTMLNQRLFIQDHIDKEKESVLLEIGKPGVLAEVLGFDLFAFLKPKGLTLPDFWESEFGVKFQSQDFTRDEERLSTLRLSADQINEHYQDFYYPSNMRIFIAGDFNKDEMIEKITNTWGKLPRRDGKKLPQIEKVKPSPFAYVRTKVTDGTPSVSYGAKAWDLDREDEEILETYTNYLAHVLMKELRNKKGQTYSVVPTTEFFERFGYALINFETPGNNFSENYKLVKNLINDQTQKHGLTTAQFEEAKSLYLQKYDLNDANSETMLRIAELFFYYHRFYNDSRSPHEILQPISIEKFNERLKSLFAPNKRYSYIFQPPYWFRHEQLVLMFLVFAFTLMLMKVVLIKPFQHTHLRWMRKVSYPPFKIAELFIVVIACYAFTFIEFFAIDLPFYKFAFLSDSLWYAEYLPVSISMVLLTAMLVTAFAFFPKRLLIVDDKLVIKSMTYYSRSIPLSEIESVHSRFFLSVPFWRVRFRFYFMKPFWRRGLLVNLKNGRSWYFGVSNADKTCAEIQSQIQERQQLTSPPAVRWRINV